MTAMPYSLALTRALLPLLPALALACGGEGDAGVEEQSPVSMLVGEALLPEGAELPPGSSLQVRLLDVTVPGEVGVALASLSVEEVGSSPVRFELPYGPAAIQHLRVYGLEIRVEHLGETQWRTTLPEPVLSGTEQSPVRVQLQPAEVAAWWDPAALDGFAEALDARMEGLPTRSGSGVQGDDSYRWTAFMEDGVPVVVQEEIDRGSAGRVAARYHVEQGRVFRYEEHGEKVVLDLSGAGRLGPHTLLLHFGPGGELLRGVKTTDGVRTELNLREVDQALARAQARVAEAAGRR